MSGIAAPNGVRPGRAPIGVSPSAIAEFQVKTRIACECIAKGHDYN